jgi:hypothetical protein
LKLVALAIGLAAVTIAALLAVVVLRGGDDPAGRDSVTAVSVQVPLPPTPAAPSRAQSDAGVAVEAPRHAFTDEERARFLKLWPIANSKDITAAVPLGPFEALGVVCDARSAAGPACKITEQDVESATFSKVGTVEIGEPMPPNPTGMPSSVHYAAVKSATGWYVLPFVRLVDLNESNLYLTPKPADDALVVQYHFSEGNRHGYDEEDGIVVCKPARGAVACTPRVAVQQRTWSEPNTTVVLACVASYAGGALHLAAMPAPDQPDGFAWSRQAAAKCGALPYAGNRPIAF